MSLAAISIYRNFGAGSKQRLLPQVSFYEDLTLQAQQHLHNRSVYEYANDIAQKNGIKRIIDFGCNIGENLVEIFSSEIIKIGIDHPNLIAGAQKKYGKQAEFIATNLEDAYALSSVVSVWEDKTPTLFIASYILEYLADPRPLLRELRRLLRGNEQNRLLLATQNRLSEQNSDGFPQDPCMVRNWSDIEFVEFLKLSGFTVHYTEVINETVLVEVSLNEAEYEAFLENYYLPKSANTLVITTEHADTKRTGGIGTYVKLLADLIPCMIYFIDDMQAASQILLQQNKWIHQLTFFDKEVLSQVFDNKEDCPELVWAVMQQVIFYYDSLEVIESQEYRGMSYLVAQAKDQLLLPVSIQFQVFCHGSTYYVLNNFATLPNQEMLDIIYNEKEVIEKAEHLIFPTRYLYNLYCEAGYKIKIDNVKFQPLPFLFESEVTPDHISKKQQKIDTLIFFGKRTRMKGYNDFLVTLEQFALNQQESTEQQIKTIIFLTPSREIPIPQWIYEKFNVKEQNLPRAEVLAFLANHKYHALIIMPYVGDNYPVSFLEIINLEIPFIGYDAGGIPEIVPKAFHSFFLTASFPNALAIKIAMIINTNCLVLRENVWSLKKEVVERQNTINAHFLALYNKKNANSSFTLTQLSEFTVTIPVYNTDFKYLCEALQSINYQWLKPKEVILVNDGSTIEGYAEALEKFVAATLTVPYHIIHQENKGLPAARNTALKHVSTPLFVTLDSDDIYLPNAFYLGIKVLSLRPKLTMLTPFIYTFPENCAAQNLRYAFDTMHEVTWQPSHQSLVRAIKIENSFGTSAAFLRTEDIKAIQGWDDSDKSTWEDFAFYAKLNKLGYQTTFLPKVLFLYRVRKNSMLRSYDPYFGIKRLIRNMNEMKLNHFDLWVLMGLLQKRNTLECKIIIPGREGENIIITAGYYFRFCMLLYKIVEHIRKYPVLRKMLKGMLLPLYIIKRGKRLFKAKV